MGQPLLFLKQGLESSGTETSGQASTVLLVNKNPLELLRFPRPPPKSEGVQSPWDIDQWSKGPLQTEPDHLKKWDFSEQVNSSPVSLKSLMPAQQTVAIRAS